jgi:predicted permease
MITLGEDLRFGLRTLRKRPWFTAATVVTLTLGIGANTVIFGAVNALLLQAPPGVQQAERVVEVGRSYQGRGFDTFSYPDLLALRERATPLEQVAGWSLVNLSMSRGGPGQRVDAMLVSANYFEILGVNPAYGRFFLEDEDDPNVPVRTIVLSYQFWRDRFGSDASVVGTSLSINREMATVVGIAPESFGGHMSLLQPDMWIPMGMLGSVRPGTTDDLEHPNNNWLMVVARLGPDATVAQASAAVRRVFDQQRDRFPREYRQKSGRVLPIGPVPGAGRGAIGAFLGVLMGLVGLVLLVTCANVAGMLVARALERRREIAIRLALGCGRSRLVRLLVAETLVLFTVAAGLATALTAWLLDTASRLQLSIPLPVHLDMRVDGLVLVFAFALALLTGLAFGVVPALRASRPNLVDSLKQAGAGFAGGGRAVLRTVFVNAQVGLSVTLLVSAVLFLRALQTAAEVETGFDPTNVHFVSLDLSLEGYDARAGRQLVKDARSRLAQSPGVVAAAASLDLPLDLAAHGEAFYPEGLETTGGSAGLGSDFNIVSPGYFRALAIRRLAGRDFDETDGPQAAPVAIVSRALAQLAWPEQSPLGKSLRWGSQAAPERTVVGVVADVKNQTLTETPGPMVYLPYTQEWRPQVNVIARGAPGSDGMPALLQREIRALDRQLALEPTVSMEEYTAIGILPQRMAAAISTALGLLVLVLSAIGVYAVVAQVVAQRTREMGVRLALGASPGSVVALVIRGELGSVLPGMALGFGLAVVAAHVLQSLLLGLDPLDPIAFAGVAVLLVLTVALASLVPALRAAGTEPVQALRYD